ncbi:MAG: hypothetical protein GY863_14100 [bacterium]|nr:hypothetical protein [bacterium]
MEAIELFRERQILKQVQDDRMCGLSGERSHKYGTGCSPLREEGFILFVNLFRGKTSV